ncbi:mmr1/hsr1 GTP binding protein [Rhodotorula toruloides]|uniref:Guanine nucleotide-binding protein-like 1 n=1 Tax=Rhodotorula toruloides TaxID=5286 RepID=A0A511KDA9_RHOTO|nr:mmr1/hsr1 GTP binding protein [Rhodotorula toruloides]
MKRATPADPSSSPSFSPTSTASLLPTSTSKPHLGQRYRTPEQRARDEQHAGRMKLESRFIRLPKHLAERTKFRAAMDKLERPIRTELAVLTEEELLPGKKGKERAVVLPGEEEEIDEVELSCPKRPRWRYTQTKAEVEKNEEGMFRKWLAEIDSVISRPPSFDDSGDANNTPSPTFFERSLEVWRQLWRTTETSDILLVLIDVRFPLLHYPPSLRHYLRTLKPYPKPVILVLTKTDLVPRWVSEAWKRYFEKDASAQDEGDGHAEGGAKVEVVLMESYKEEERGEDTQGTHARLVPATPPPARHALLSALRCAHASLLTPPPVVASSPERLARWKPKVRKDVDWEGVEEEGGETGVRAGKKDGREADEGEKGRRSRRRKGKDELAPAPQNKEEEQSAGDAAKAGEGEEDYPFLTVGLIGQPNVGKSSLLNALLGRKVVRASRTPGKTKTLQTIYWNHSLRLCDCPGLVCPSAAGFERQVLGGILPIQNVEAVLHFVGQRIPLEKVLKLKHEREAWQGKEEEEDDEFSLDSPEERAAKRQAARPRWTTDEFLAAHALQQGFVTAKVGRPDIYRAGAFILRLLHSSTIPWTFLPPTLDAYEQQVQRDEMEGIWLKEFVPKAGAGRPDADDETGSGSEAEQASEDGEDSGGGEIESEDEDSADEKAVQAVRGAFAALAVEEGEGEEEGDSEPDASEQESD